LLQIVDEELARGTAPSKIAYVSFTRRAADEAIARATEKFGLSRAQLPWFRTLHSLCFRWLGLRPEGVLAGAASLRKFGAWAGLEVSGRSGAEEGSTQGYARGDRILHMINLARARRRPLRQQYDADDDGLGWAEVEHAWNSLRCYKEGQGLIDYTDMLEQFAAAKPRLGLDVVLLDEGQDNSALQWAAWAELCMGARRAVVAGDDDQAIYEWAGADAAHLVDMAGMPRVLGRSHRVPQAVQALAQRIISPVKRRRAKSWAAREETGAVDHVGRFEEADASGPSVLVLARNRYVLEEQAIPALRGRGMVYEYRGESSVDPGVLAAIEAWERLRAGGGVAVREAREIYRYLRPGRGVARNHINLPGFADPDEPVTMADLQVRGGLLVDGIWHEAMERLPRGMAAYILAARRCGEKLRAPPRIKLSTIHGSKGGEADDVILFTDMAARTHKEFEKRPDAEHRCWYVAVTRAKRRLTLVAPHGGQFFRL
jgi:superfamily I DNA/RNA helicase